MLAAVGGTRTLARPLRGCTRPRNPLAADRRRAVVRQPGGHAHDRRAHDRHAAREGSAGRPRRGGTRDRARPEADLGPYAAAMRQALAPLAALMALAVPAPALAARIETWTTSSRYVDPSKVQFNGPVRPPALKVNVFIPDGYDGKRTFPVLY